MIFKLADKNNNKLFLIGKMICFINICQNNFFKYLANGVNYSTFSLLIVADILLFSFIYTVDYRLELKPAN